jgi:hypothetical protein
MARRRSVGESENSGLVTAISLETGFSGQSASRADYPTRYFSRTPV